MARDSRKFIQIFEIGVVHCFCNFVVLKSSALKHFYRNWNLLKCVKLVEYSSDWQVSAERRNSTVLAVELHLSCTYPLWWCLCYKVDIVKEYLVSPQLTWCQLYVPLWVSIYCLSWQIYGLVVPMAPNKNSLECCNFWDYGFLDNEKWPNKK